MKYVLYCLGILTILSCSTLKPFSDSNIESGYYELRQTARGYTKVYLDVKKDSIAIIAIDKESKDQSPLAHIDGQSFLKRSFDIDVLAVPFKYRPSTSNVPRQLTSDFNGNIYFGYRLDRYKTRIFHTPIGQVKKIQHHAITMGTFGGLGTTFVSPWTTNYQTNDEYNGLVLTRGLSIMAGVNNLTFGVGIGWDYLTDRDKEIWIYQNKPWYGVTISLNIN
jgi:hypothetical protein